MGKGIKNTSRPKKREERGWSSGRLLQIKILWTKMTGLKLVVFLPCQPILSLCGRQGLWNREKKKEEKGCPLSALKRCACCWDRCLCERHPCALCWSKDLRLHCGSTPPLAGLYRSLQTTGRAPPAWVTLIILKFLQSPFLFVQSAGFGNPIKWMTR